MKSISFAVSSLLLLALHATGTSANKGVLPVGQNNQKHIARATKIANKVVDATAAGRRSLQDSLTAYEFRTLICEPFQQGFLSELAATGDTGRCSCATPTRYAITCTVDEFCEAGDEGCDATICTTYTAITTFFIDSGYIKIRSIEANWDITGADYTGSRLYVNQDNNGNLDCEQYFSIGNQEYQCLECSYCSDDGTVINVDCSNIQSNTTTSGCIHADDIAEDTAVLDLCLPGDAPDPSTSSVDKGTFTSISSASSSSALSAFLVFVMVAIGVSGASLL